MPGIRISPKPYCPQCGAQMVLRRPKSYQEWDAFWGCSQYPECHGTRAIDPDTGEPMMYEREAGAT